MKLSGWLLRLALIAMIGLSLVLTWLIWQNPSRLGRREQAVTVQHKATSSSTKNRAVVMLPTAAYYQKDQQKRQLFEADRDVVQSLHASIKSWRLGRVTSGGKLTASEYTALLATDDTLQLTYSGKMSYKLFNAGFFTKQASAANADFTFDRIMITLAAHKDALVFVNDETRSIHTATLTKHNGESTLLRKIQDAADSGFAVTDKRLDNGTQIADYTAAIQVQPYVYLLDQQSANHYVSLLMPASVTSNVDARELGSDTVYTAGTDYRLTLDTDTEVMQFDNAEQTTASKGLSTNLTKAYAGLAQLNLQGLTSMRYDHYDTATKTVTYRSFAQGLPIYNQNYYGRVTVANTASGQQMFFSSNNLTVPIPTDTARLSLPNTQTVLAQLVARGYRQADIQDIQLGYYWEAQGENSQVVALTPTYFVEIDGDYRRYTKWQGPAADKKVEKSLNVQAQD